MSQLRSRFLSFFDRRAHNVMVTSPIVPQGDPTLLFTSAGMVPFKPYFLGLKSGLSRAASCQRCFRTTDIDRVGTTSRHLTFFEMLGNFSFGDYFKPDAIAWAWEFLTKEAGLDPKRLTPTVHKEDDEAYQLWSKQPIRNSVIRLGSDANFWAVGPTGPCGPCSEIYIDLGAQLGCGKPDCAPGCDCDRYLEIWNLVFMQFDRQADGTLKPLPQKNIDTGMGLERLTLAVNNKLSPFDTELFTPIIDVAAKLLHSEPGKSPLATTAFRIVSDHARGACVLAAEGIIPSNVERGYVLRRLIRRAVRHGQLLGHQGPFLHQLVEPTLKVLGEFYPELAKARTQIENTIRAEEDRFLETLEKGEIELRQILEAHPRQIPGEVAFKLYETFGFPFELTKEICVAAKVAVDEEGFAKAQQQAAEVARAGWKGAAEKPATINYEAFVKANPGLHCEFHGYQTMTLETRVVGVIRYKKAETRDPNAEQQLLPGDEGEVVLHKTPFYAESGGQVGDKGLIFDDVGNKVAEVHDTQKPHADLIVHKVTALRLIRPGLKVKAEVERFHRETVRYHHTATHLLNAALRQVLGDNIRQAGSLVAPDRLRFDFTHPKPMTPEEQKQVEDLVNSAIAADMPVETQERPAADIDILKPTVLLGENYGAKPRFVLIGPQGFNDPQQRYSMELCGGTHVHRTGEIRHMKIVRETSVAAGIRRIEAVAGPALEEHQRMVEEGFRKQLQQMLERYLKLTSEVQELTGKPFKAIPRRLPNPDTAPLPDIKRSIEALRELEKMLKAELTNLKSKALAQQAHVGRVVFEIGTIKACVQKFKEAELATLRTLSDQIKHEMGTCVVFLGSSDNEKFSFVVGVTADLAGKGQDAAKLARAVAEVMGGKAGGRPDFAQGGGSDYDWDSLVNKFTALVEAAQKA